ncbi:MAG: aminopeptidase P family protein [Erysipelotrichales bacterium]|nr:MAG: aminopeptidase P family protein [Erysipelotrichales bacterium]
MKKDETMLNYLKRKQVAMRVQELFESMSEAGVKRLLITYPELIEYVIGRRFHVSERFIGLLLQDGRATLFLNLLFPYINEEIEIVRFHDIEDPIALLADKLNGDELWVDRYFASGFLLRLLKLKPSLNVDDGTYSIDRIRARKSLDEQDKMRAASRINDQVMAEVRNVLIAGVTEIEIAEFITRRFNELADGVSFPPIVAFGDHTADPHAECGDRKLVEGMPIIIDMGCVKDGYCSDMTRSFSIGKAWNAEVYDTVKRANLAGIAVVKPGVPLREIDAAARKIIVDAGFGDQFIHRLGHGIGKEVHEPFDVSGVSGICAFEGMCFSIEPGIYLEGVGGVRIEDLVLVTATGCEILNAYPKDNEVIR